MKVSWKSGMFRREKVKKYRILERMHHHYLVAVVRGESKEDALHTTTHIIDGGMRNIEITFTTPEAYDVIAEVKRLFSEDDIVVGAGTVLDPMTARLAIVNGAEYIVSPHLDKDIAKMCNLYSIPYLPGCGSVTEITEALTYGVDVVKLFPGDLLGANFIKNVHGPIPHIEMMPSGGVALNNLHEWIEKGAFAVGIGSALTKGAQSSHDEIIASNTEQFVKKYREIVG